MSDEFRRLIGLATLARMVAKSKNMPLDDAFRFVVHALPVGGVAVLMRHDDGFPDVLYRGAPGESQDGILDILSSYENSRWWLDECSYRDVLRSIYRGVREFPGPDDIAISRADAARIFGVSFSPSEGARQSEPSSAALECDDPRWPEELGIALTAWRAACNGVDGSGKRPGAFIREWLAAHYSSLSSEAVKRIATVANWDKQPGASKRE